MAGMLSGFNQGWGLMNQKIQQDKADQRYEENKAEDQRRYETNLGFRQAQEERNQASFDNQQEQYNYGKTLRPLNEKSLKLGIQSKSNSNQLQRQQISANAQEAQMKQINYWGDRLHEQLNSGTLTPETLKGFQGASNGTAFNLDNVIDPEYQKSLDYLSQSITDPTTAGKDPNALAAFNRVFKDQINTGKMVGNGVRKEISGLSTQNGHITFDVTTYDANGKAIRTAPLTTGRSPDDSDGNKVLVDFGDIVDQVQARKMIAATYLANPRLKDEVMRVHNQLHPVNDAALKARNKLAPRSQQLQKLFQAAQKQRDSMYRSAKAPDMFTGQIPSDDQSLSVRDQADLDYNNTLKEIYDTYSPAEFEAAGIPYSRGNTQVLQQPNGIQPSKSNQANQGASDEEIANALIKLAGQ